MTATYSINAQLNGIEISFPSRPAAAVLDTLKSAGFRWSRARSIWYAKQTPERLTVAQSVTAGNVGQTVQKPQKTALLPLWERCDVSTIPEHNRHADTRTIAAETRQHLKQRFPECKFSVRIGSGGWSASNCINAYITAAPYPPVIDTIQR